MLLVLFTDWRAELDLSMGRALAISVSIPRHIQTNKIRLVVEVRILSDEVGLLAALLANIVVDGGGGDSRR